jgi:ABC-type branched-subunit amino acid transport system ATPase component
MHLVKDLFKRIIIMDAGAVVADGPTEAILEDVDLLERHGLEGT